MTIDKCVWKHIREQNLKGIGISFSDKEYMACDDCTGYKRITCYNPSDKLDKEIISREQEYCAE